MSSKREEERNEKIIRGLLKLPPNRKCINCNSLGPQYVCTNFWTFVCVTCSGIHREFTHRVKSVSMSKFTPQEVEALQRGGNQRAREIFLKDWDPQQMRLPDSREIDKIREFIKNVYVDRKYAGGRYSEKPPRDVQSQKNHDAEHRRASSYHSYSQSPPYEYQYEERRYGKQTGMLSRKPGSDRGHYEGKISSFMYSPGSQQEHTCDDTGSRISDYSVSSTGDPSRFDVQSPNFQDTVYSSPPSQQARDILIDTARPQTLSTYSEGNIKKDSNGLPLPKRTASSDSFGSLDSISMKSANSSLIDTAVEPECAPGNQQNGKFVSPVAKLPAATHVKDQDLFNLPVAQQPVISSGSSIDLFAAINCPNSSSAVENKEPAAPVSGNVGWATFDVPQAAQVSDVNQGFSSMFPSNVKAHENTDLFSLMPNNPQLFSLSATHGPLPSVADQWHLASNNIKGSVSVSTNSSESWNAFGDSSGSFPQNLFKTVSQTCGSEPHAMVNKPLVTSDMFGNYGAPEVYTKDGLQSSHSDESVESFPSTMLPLMGETTRQQKSTNPFDLPFDSDPEVDNMFMDMSSLRETFPGGQLPDTYLDSLAQAWFPQNSAATYVPSLPQGGLPYMVGQVPTSQLTNITSQNTVASLGGNPFA